MIDTFALWLGYAVMISGGLALATLGLWGCFEIISKHIGWSATLVGLLYDEAKRRRAGAG